MEFYSEREGLLKADFKINVKDLRDYFFQVYSYFHRKRCFDFAFYGKFTPNDMLVDGPSMRPSPEVYFLLHLGDIKVFPIEENYTKFNKDTLFTIIEILYQHIAIINYELLAIEKEQVQEEYRESINSILRLFESGYRLDKKGFIMNESNEGLLELLNIELPKTTPISVMEKVNVAIKLFYSYKSTQDEKRSAIESLAFILEPLRDDLKEMLNKEFNIKKNCHEQTLFQIVNDFGIRHNNAKINNEYSKEIWYDWMFQQYLNLIQTMYRLKEKYEVLGLF